MPAAAAAAGAHVQLGSSLGRDVAVACHFSLTGAVVAAPHDPHSKDDIPKIIGRRGIDGNAAGGTFVVDAKKEEREVKWK